MGTPAPPLRNLWKLHGDSEASHLLRPTAGHRDLSRPQPRRLLVGHIHDGEAAEVLLGLDERTVGEQRRAARRIDTEHGAASSRPPVKMKTPAAFISATNGLTARDFSRSSSTVWSGTHSSLKAMRYSVMSPPLPGVAPAATPTFSTNGGSPIRHRQDERTQHRTQIGTIERATCGMRVRSADSACVHECG